MRIVYRAMRLLPTLLAAAVPLWALGGCGAADPPLDQLELRDALMSDPVVIAGLSQEAQQRLAGRFWAAVALPEQVQTLTQRDASSPEQRLRRMDVLRQQRGQDAFLMGVWSSDLGVVTVSPFYRPARPTPSSPLPPLLGRPSGVTQVPEARALAGRAGAAIEDLRNVSGAVYLERVTGWPTAVLAIGDRVYINATWLTAVAALESAEPKNPAQSGALSQPGSASSLPGRASLYGSYGNLSALPEGGSGIAAATHALSADAVDPAAPESGEPAASGGFGSCSSSSCASSSCNSSSCSSASATPSSCTVNLCSSTADKECCRACALAPERSGRDGPDLSTLWMMLWLSVPLLFLTGVDLLSRLRERLRAERTTRRSEGSGR